MAGTRDLRRRVPAVAALLCATAVLGLLLLPSPADEAPDGRRKLWPSPYLSQFADPRSVMLRGATLPGLLGFSDARYQLTEDEAELRLEVDVPGVRPEDLTTELEDGGRVLHIRGTRRCATGEEVSVVDERFRLGRERDAADVAARLSHGVLVLTVAKHEEPPPANVAIPVRVDAPETAELEIREEGAPVVADGRGEAPAEDPAEVPEALTVMGETPPEEGLGMTKNQE